MSKIPSPFVDELPSQYADRLGNAYAKSSEAKDKKAKGQFFTPLEIGHLMASMVNCQKSKLKILDPGSGLGLLTCCMVEALGSKVGSLKSIEITVFETDDKLIPLLSNVLSYLQSYWKSKNIEISYSIHQEDFILHFADQLRDESELFIQEKGRYDIVISNPPYFKLPIADPRAIAAKVVVNGHPNIYAIFMALGAKLLTSDGELVFITPRSYASGGYFRQFRNYFFSKITIERIHLFVSRKDTFAKDKVLQETVIIKGRKKSKDESEIQITSSAGIKDLDHLQAKTHPYKEILDQKSKDKILYLPTSQNEEEILLKLKQWTYKLSDFGIKVSTGPVVAFRSRSQIREQFENGTVFLAPLYWLHNVTQMVLTWPITKPEKGQYILINEETSSILLPSKNYVFLRRFSSKDDKSRLIAAPYFGSEEKEKYVGVENKLNYIYKPSGELSKEEVLGIAAILNSTVFDTLFRVFNGNVNVSATELKGMPFPSIEQIIEIGNEFLNKRDFSKENIDLVINNYFETEVVHETEN